MRPVEVLVKAAQTRWRILPLTGLVVLLLGLGQPALTAETPAEAVQEGAEPVLDVWMEDGLLSLEAQDAPLAEVLAEIAEAANFRLVTKADLTVPVTKSFEKVPVGEAIARLLGRMSSVALYEPAPDGDGRVLAELRILSGRPGDAAATAMADDDGVEEPLPSPELALEGTDPHLDRLREQVGKMSATAARDLTAAAAGDEDPVARRIAVVGLGNLGAKTVGPAQTRARRALEEALSDEDELVRQRAVQGLTRIAGKDALEPLRQVLSEDPAPKVRRMAAARLGRIDDDAALSALVAAQSDSDPSVREAASTALARHQRRSLGQGN